jgi:RNA polymerase primary sigma factor
MNERINSDSYDRFLLDLQQLPVFSNDENVALIRKYQESHDENLRNQIVEGNMRLVLSIALKNSRKFHLPAMDLVQEGSLGLLQAVENFNFDFQVPFSSFAGTKIQNTIYDYMTTYSNIISIPRYLFRKVSRIEKVRSELLLMLHRDPTDEEIAAQLKDGYTAQKVRDTLSLFTKTISLDVSLNKDSLNYISLMDNLSDGTDPSENYQNKEIARFYQEALDFLPKRNRDIFLCRTKEDGPRYTLEELSKKYDISKERIRQIEEESIEKIRSYVLKKL